jgi:BirA family biotin operon repressor/biotin-[acetyl-CoA-carboxylase] ligase
VWSSPPGAGLYFSIVLRPAHGRDDDRVVSMITLAAGVAMHDAIARATGLTVDLKWPNDVVLGRRKLAGILAEGLALGSPQQAIVLGIGVNVLRAVWPADIAERATSLETELGHAVDRGTLLEEILVAIAGQYHALRRGKADDILRAWRAVSPSAHGARVEWVDRDQHGITAGIDDHGALLVGTDTGVERVISGELRWM